MDPTTSPQADEIKTDRKAIEAWVSQNYDPEEESADEFIDRQDFRNQKRTNVARREAVKIEREHKKEVSVERPISKQSAISIDRRGEVRVRSRITGQFRKITSYFRRSIRREK